MSERMEKIDKAILDLNGLWPKGTIEGEFLCLAGGAYITKMVDHTAFDFPPICWRHEFELRKQELMTGGC